MKHSEIVTLSTRDLIPHPRNPRKISQEDLNRLCDSIRTNGYWQHRPMAVEPVPDKPGKYYIYHHTSMVYLQGNHIRL